MRLAEARALQAAMEAAAALSIAAVGAFRDPYSTLDAASLRRIGLREATDLEGGFQAWKAADLPTRPTQSLG